MNNKLTNINLKNINSINELTTKLNEDLNTTLKSLGHYLIENEKELEKITEERKKIQMKEKELSENVEKIKELIKSGMVENGIKEVESSKMIMKIANGSEKVEVIDAKAVPDVYNRIIQKVEVDKQAILVDWKRTGIIIPGVEIVKVYKLNIKEKE